MRSNLASRVCQDAGKKPQKSFSVKHNFPTNHRQYDVRRTDFCFLTRRNNIAIQHNEVRQFADFERTSLFLLIPSVRAASCVSRDGFRNCNSLRGHPSLRMAAINWSPIPGLGV